MRPDEHEGDFAEGQEAEHPDHRREGSFAEGQEEKPGGRGRPTRAASPRARRKTSSPARGAFWGNRGAGDIAGPPDRVRCGCDRDAGVGRRRWCDRRRGRPRRRAARPGRGARRAARPGRGHDRPLPRPAALGRPLRGQGSRTPPGSASTRTASCAGSRRTASRTPAASSSARRPTTSAYGDTFRDRVRRRRHPGRGDRPGRGAAARAAAAPGHHARIRRCPTERSTPGCSWARAPRTSSATAAPCSPTTTSSSVIVEGDRVCGARVRDTRTGEETEVRAQITVSATGAWAGRLAEMAGCAVHVRGGRGVMVALNHRLAHAVINRCRLPGDSDILVPAHTVSVIGTTDNPVEDPDDRTIPAADVRKLLDEGSEIVPHIREARALRAWAGLRPLYSEHDTGYAGTRQLSRGFTLLDHREREGVAGFLTITGGKLTTFRLHGRGDRRRGVRAPGRRRRLPHRRRAPARLRGRAHPSGGRPSGRARGQPARRAGDLRVRARHPRHAARRRGGAPDARTWTTSAGRCGSAWGRARAGSASRGRPACSTAEGHMDAAAANAAVRAFVEERWQGRVADPGRPPGQAEPAGRLAVPRHPGHRPPSGMSNARVAESWSSAPAWPASPARCAWPTPACP